MITEHIEERRQLEEAVERLVSGAAIRSDGQFTVLALAEESQIKRARIYEQYPDIIAAFRARTGHAPPPPAMRALQAELDDLRTESSELRQENMQLRERIRILSAAITELTLADGDHNVVPLRR
jgi:hypothetical protein